MDVCQVYLPAPKALASFLPSSAETRTQPPARKKAKNTAKNPQNRAQAQACGEVHGDAGGSVRGQVDEVYNVLVTLGKAIEPCGSLRSCWSSSLGSEATRDAADGLQEFELYSQTQVDPSSPDGMCTACDDEEIPWNVMTVMRWNALAEELQAASSRGEVAACALCEQMAARVLEADHGEFSGIMWLAFAVLFLFFVCGGKSEGEERHALGSGERWQVKQAAAERK